MYEPEYVRVAFCLFVFTFFEMALLAAIQVFFFNENKIKLLMPTTRHTVCSVCRMDISFVPMHRPEALEKDRGTNAGCLLNNIIKWNIGVKIIHTHRHTRTYSPIQTQRDVTIKMFQMILDLSSA